MKYQDPGAQSGDLIITLFWAYVKVHLSSKTQGDKMSKKYIIILVIAVVSAVGLYIYQNQKKEQDLRSHHSGQYSRMIEAAHISSTAGLVHMAGALNKYKEKNGAYPAGLSALYPDYIPEKAFIDDIQWHYKPNGKDFYLSKTITTKGDKMLTASIGPNLMPQEESDIMVASTKVPKRAASRTKNQSSKKSPKTGVSRVSRSKPKPMAKALTPDIASTGRKNSRGKLSDSTTPVILQKRPLSELEKVSTHKITEKEQFLHKATLIFLVWKNADGSLGFSDSQYPTSKEFSLYNNGEWVQTRPRNKYAKSQNDVRQNKNK